ncbi:hypothetical protein BJX65DRAFT_276097 [Aspergillus insuetus]
MHGTDMHQLQQFNLIENLVRFEAEMASLKFSAYGNLYFRDSIDQGSHVIPGDDKYCIGGNVQSIVLSSPRKWSSCRRVLVVNLSPMSYSY